MNLNQNPAWEDKTFWIQKHDDLYRQRDLNQLHKYGREIYFWSRMSSLKEKDKKQKWKEKRVDIGPLLEIRLFTQE